MQKGGASFAYVVYRQVVAVYFGLHVLLLIVGSFAAGHAGWLVFFSFWALLVLTLNVVLQAVFATTHYHRLKANNHG